jgi:hypothetical protein
MDYAYRISSGIFYKQEQLNEKLKCPMCKSKFDDPRILPCGDSVCYNCLLQKQEENNNNYLIEFTCPVCQELYKNLDPKQLAQNKLVIEILKMKPGEIYRNKSVNELVFIMKQIESKIRELKFDELAPREEIKYHCNYLRNRIDLASSKLKERVRHLDLKFYNQINEYEIDCLKHLECAEKNAQTKQQLEQLFSEFEKLKYEVSKFIQQKAMLLQEFQIDDDEVERSVNKSKEYLCQIESQLFKYNSFVFKPGKLEFIANADQIESDDILGRLFYAEKPIDSNLPTFNHTKLELSLNILDQHHIWLVEYLSPQKYLVYSSYNKLLYANLLNENGFLLNQAVVIECEEFSEKNFSIKSASLVYKNVLCVGYFNKFSNSFATSVFLYDENLKFLSLLNVKSNDRVLAIALNDSQFYTIQRAAHSKKNYMSTYQIHENQFAFIASTKEANKESDPFYFSPGLIEFRVLYERIYVMENEQMKELDEKTGIVQRIFSIQGSTFSIYMDSFIVTLDRIKNKVFYFELNGKLIKQLDLPKKLNEYEHKSLSNSKVVAFNTKNKSKVLLLE